MNRRHFIELTALIMGGTCILPPSVHADEPDAALPDTQTVDPVRRPPVTFVQESGRATTEGFSDARSCTCIVHETYLFK